MERKETLINPENFVDKYQYLKDQQADELRFRSIEVDVDELQKDRTAMFESLKKLPDSIDRLDDTITLMDRKMFESEYGYKDLNTRVSTIEEITSSRRSGNVKIWVAVISALALLGGSALTFAEIFFR